MLRRPALVCVLHGVALAFSTPCHVLRPLQRASFDSVTAFRSLRGGSVVAMGRKPGVMEPDELRKFVEQAGDKLIVVDARNPDFAVEPGDEGTHATGGIPGLAGGGGPDRPRAVNAPYDRAQSCLDLSKIPAEWVEAGGGKESVPVVTHCGGCSRAEAAPSPSLCQCSPSLSPRTPPGALVPVSLHMRARTPRPTLTRAHSQVEEAGDRRPRTTCWQTASRTSPTAAGPRTPSAGPSLAASKERRAARASVASSLSRGPVVLSVGVRCTSCGYLGQLPHRVLRRRRLVITNAAKQKLRRQHHKGRTRRPQSDPSMTP